jgi:hypothetical protein
MLFLVMEFIKFYLVRSVKVCSLLDRLFVIFSKSYIPGNFYKSLVNFEEIIHSGRIYKNLVKIWFGN